ncbi:ammonium transporter [Streptosporangium sp. NBC_01755]|uniref:ammonium transporter n=1 Tax=unclassified Streptosporangium TaxID=2632669 RepID=UPI002DDAEC9F|nr:MULTISPECIES: ammonium transporter [unclassified Streptosporangium]WSA23822.1 ammonium transporter [Streptosporangium sp. NBC_01810]WSC98106.1 ammonium transporter [Streptosporangium sp. NBC_01755]
MKIDSGTTAWMLTATALVLLMTPGLAFFYGGMTRAKSVLNMMMMSFVSIITVTIAWVLYGHSLTFTDNGNELVNKFVGGFDALGLQSLVDTATKDDGTGMPSLVFSAFQLTFAIITVALISGAIADRAKFGAWVLFTIVWATIVYFPVAHWVWGNGWLFSLGIEDFAGGTVVHINAGAAALALALVLGKRAGWRKEPMRPHNLTLVLLGAGLLWFGWFGFNAGSELAVDGTAGLAFMNTQIATAAAAGAWLVVEKIRDGHATSLGVASGAVAGLVAVTPACGFVDPWAALILGLVAGAACAYAVGLKYKFGYDDSLDVVGVHLVGGVIGAVSLGFIAAYPFLEQQSTGLLYGGGIKQLGLQILGPVAVGAYSFIITWIIAKIIDKTMGFRIGAEEEIAGVDITSHAETGYDLGTIHSSGVAAVNGPAPTPASKKVDA